MSTITQTVALTDARFYAYHGYYPEEQVWGNEFFVSIQASFSPDRVDPDDLDSILNYEELYAVARSVMGDAPEKLLETLAERMLDEVRRRFGYVDALSATIHKTRPPFGGDAVGAKVSLAWTKT